MSSIIVWSSSSPLSSSSSSSSCWSSCQVSDNLRKVLKKWIMLLIIICSLIILITIMIIHDNNVNLLRLSSAHWFTFSQTTHFFGISKSVKKISFKTCTLHQNYLNSLLSFATKERRMTSSMTIAKRKSNPTSEIWHVRYIKYYFLKSS